MRRLFVDFGHPYRVLLRIETVEAARLGIELIPKDDMQVAQGGGGHSPIMRLPAGWLSAISGLAAKAVSKSVMSVPPSGRFPKAPAAPCPAAR